MIGELDEGCRSDNLNLRARPGGFRTARGWANQTLAAGIGADGRRQDSRYRCDRAVEPKLTQNSKSRQRVMLNGTNGRHQPERDRQIVVAALLGQVRRREIDSDTARR